MRVPVLSNRTVSTAASASRATALHCRKSSQQLASRNAAIRKSKMRQARESNLHLDARICLSQPRAGVFVREFHLFGDVDTKPGDAAKWESRRYENTRTIHIPWFLPVLYKTLRSDLCLANTT